MAAAHGHMVLAPVDGEEADAAHDVPPLPPADDDGDDDVAVVESPATRLRREAFDKIERAFKRFDADVDDDAADAAEYTVLRPLALGAHKRRRVSVRHGGATQYIVLPHDAPQQLQQIDLDHVLIEPDEGEIRKFISEHDEVVLFKLECRDRSVLKLQYLDELDAAETALANAHPEFIEFAAFKIFMIKTRDKLIKKKTDQLVRVRTNWSTKNPEGELRVAPFNGVARDTILRKYNDDVLFSGFTEEERQRVVNLRAKNALEECATICELRIDTMRRTLVDLKTATETERADALASINRALATLYGVPHARAAQLKEMCHGAVLSLHKKVTSAFDAAYLMRSADGNASALATVRKKMALEARELRAQRAIDVTDDPDLTSVNVAGVVNEALDAFGTRLTKTLARAGVDINLHRGSSRKKRGGRGSDARKARNTKGGDARKRGAKNDGARKRGAKGGARKRGAKGDARKRGDDGARKRGAKSKSKSGGGARKRNASNSRNCRECDTSLDASSTHNYCGECFAKWRASGAPSRNKSSSSGNRQGGVRRRGGRR